MRTTAAQAKFSQELQATRHSEPKASVLGYKSTQSRQRLHCEHLISFQKSSLIIALKFNEREKLSLAALSQQLASRSKGRINHISYKLGSYS
jgi:hypothetical protein